MVPLCLLCRVRDGCLLETGESIELVHTGSELAGELRKKAALGEGRGVEDANAVNGFFVLAKIQGVEVAPDEVLHLLDHLADVGEVLLVVLECNELRALAVSSLVHQLPGASACRSVWLLRQQRSSR